ncbi:putative bifunctional diguanylate cyclase/phosphodiesterase [Actinoplanes palleronii]|uniref:Bifunctional diguanylate cyclase/phosphodiesterase n=1 Tax=Actinoplanes palleronii TaxID=113570 RepID=A0ABQ4BL41_9ACTN|nr:bifunctional diguanylate cyclase/phosphodiesterase [Actinoplanes palleronii]GIE71401.1 bifunctional diguanylate cyclase/phosphodiesterase [Actinoplanes palleronii]
MRSEPRRRTPVVLALIGLVTAGLVLAVLGDRGRLVAISLSALVLDLIGAAYSWRAAQYSPAGRAPWLLVAGGRAASVGVTVGLWGAALDHTTGWWAGLGAGLRVLMYALLAAGVLIPMFRLYTGRSRTALLAEVGTVIAAGFMVVWYFVLAPVLTRQGSAEPGVGTIGWPLGDLLLLGAVASIVLRGAINRIAAPISLFGVGLALYLAGDVIWMANGADAANEDLPVLIVMVLAGLFMTAAPILTVSRSGHYVTTRTNRPPAWATHLPMAAMLVGCLLMLTVTLLEGQLLPWGGLVCGLIVMTCTAALRQLISLRQTRDQLTADALTGLANRAGLDEAIDRAIKRGDPAALLLVDLDGFRLVNDAYGHAAGDTFLIQVAHQLRSAVRSTDVCARIGADEFVVLLTGARAGGVETAVEVAERILADGAGRPVRIDDDVVPVRASIGIACAVDDYDGKLLLRQADTAMYHSKRAGSHSYACYQPSMVDHRADDAALAEDLQHALDRGELHVLYQPQVDLATGAPIAAEALIRWQHPARGPISPVRFIPVAERSATIIGIGLWVLEQALRQMMVFDDPFHVSVNVSPRQLREPTIVHDILAVLGRVGADPRRLVLEVTESALVDEAGEIAALRALREHGIRIAIDDFGTGYSSLQYLTRLPVDILKIDRSFVAEMDDTPEGSAVAAAVIRLAQVLHLSTVAEGIETEDQAAELRALGCDIGQGFLYAKPLSPSDLVAFAQVPAR